MEKVNYLNQPNCYRLTNGTVEVIVTTDIGPRIIRYGFLHAENILGEFPEVTIKTELGDWKPWGGHRLWGAPEANPRSYTIDNSPIEYESLGSNSIRLIQQTAPEIGIRKEIIVSLNSEGTGVTIDHQITNRNLWGIDVAPWALTIMNGGGFAILPQEPYRSWDEYLLPARPMILWHFTDLTDPRWTIGQKFICLKTDAAMEAPQKIGILNKQGWAAYWRNKTLFVKYFNYEDGARYPDYGSNNETFTSGSLIEVETLAPIHHLEPGESAEHQERWHLFKEIEMSARETDIESTLIPLIARTK